MQGIYLLSLWLHFMAAVAWVGGTIFLDIVLVSTIAGASLAASLQP